MMLAARGAIRASGAGLPYDAEVEYLESSGTQYIDTGVVPTSDTSVEIGYKTADAQLNKVLFGRRIKYTDRSYCIWANANGKIRFDYTSHLIDNVDGPNAIVGVWVNVAKRKERNYVDATEYTANTATTFECTGNAYLFGMNDNGVAAWLITAQVAYCKIYQNGTLVRDFIPVRKKTVGYLYDRVSGKLFGNAGTGDFVLGPDVVPVEYILQTGTQYIDTLYPMADTRREVITVDWSGHSTTYREFMAGAASGSYLIELSPSGYYGTAYNDYSSIHVSTKDKIRWDYTVGIKPYLYINDVFAIQGSLLRVPTGNIQTGGVGTPGVNYPKMKIYGLDIFTDAYEQVRKMRPIRVGTDATSWAGAMIDTLTRRIYRNAGTGAFAYGNDLKYPIPA